LAELVLEIDESCLLIPAHAWTPWFSVYGSGGGFDSLYEAFGEHADKILAIETGLSSDPAMNWCISELDGRAIVSFSDAHSPSKLGREATVFELEAVDYSGLRKAILDRKIVYTIEYYPEEGKYHYNGHRACGVVQSVEQTKNLGTSCPVCGRMQTLGVMWRVEKLAEREAVVPQETIDEYGVKWYKHPNSKTKPAFVRLVPLFEILAQVYLVGVGAKKVGDAYERLVRKFGCELRILMSTPIDEIASFGGERLGEAVARVRRGEIWIEPGYDGVFGVVKIWGGKKAEVAQGVLF
jgi:uncharacterized protein (TIGR00375 family)